MSDSVVVNVISPEVTNINVTDTGENIYINPLTLNQGIINHSVTHQSGGSDELLHNLLGGLQGGSGGNYYHLTSGQYANLVTGAVIRPSDTGAFYPSYNPSGFITGVDLSAYVTGDVVRPSETGNFITTSQTGAFYPRSNPSGFIVPSQTGAFYAASNPSGFITGVDLSAYVTGDVVRPSQTGAFYPASNPSGFITGVDLSAYVTGSVVRPSETGNFISFAALTGDRGDITITGDSPSNLNFSIDNSAITNTKIADGAVTTSKIANFNITTDKLGSLAVTTNIIASNAVTNTKLADMASQRIKGRISAGTSDPEDLTASQVRTLIDFDNTVSGLLSGYVTGSVVRPSETGAFYAASNPSGFITGVDLSAYVTGDVVRPSQTGAFYPISNPSGYVTGSVVRPSETGSFITISQTGVFYPTSNPSGFVTGLVVRPSETGSFITTAQTGVFYPASNPSGFATAVDPVRTTLTGNGIVSGYAISGANNLINPSALIVAIDGALQEPSVDYTVNSGQITFTSPLPSGSKAVVISPSNSLIAGQVVPSDGSVTSAKIAGGVAISDPILSDPVVNGQTLSSGNVVRTEKAFARKFIASDFTYTGVSQTIISNFTHPIVAGKTYRIYSMMSIVGQAGSTHQCDMLGTFNASWTNGFYRRAGFETTNFAITSTPFALFGYFNSTGTQFQTAFFEGFFTASTSGELRVRVGSNSASASVTLSRNSFYEIQEW